MSGFMWWTRVLGKGLLTGLGWMLFIPIGLAAAALIIGAPWILFGLIVWLSGGGS